jgi:arginine utilization protein RocB
VTKLTGTINKKVLDRQRKSIERIRRRQEKKLSKRQRSLAELEDEVEKLLLKETLVLITQDFIDRMRSHYNLVMEEEQQEAHKKAQEEGLEVFSH